MILTKSLTETTLDTQNKLKNNKMRISEFYAEIETTFQNFAETGDIDRISIKGWVISCLREFGKNICDWNFKR